ncbi:MAG TPA: HIT domain-containing protein [Candidatus Angelobacter sp.]|nr:HIT domain-containing protein [Candidatus Angelobacter sp.]
MSGAEAWDRLWTPHRMAYIRGQDKPRHTGAGDECPFCTAPTLEGDTSLVVARGDLVYAVLNLYPYNTGHLMVCPSRHVAAYTELEPAEVAELGAFTQHAMTTLRSVAGAQGFNIGLNQGSVSGAGVAGHLHQHVVPRWGGDTNFMAVIGGTKTLPELLLDTRDLVAAAW